MDKFAEIRVPISHKNICIKRKGNKCVLCGKCKDVCKKQMGVAGYWKYDSEDIVCINCGQCANFCPVGAISECDNSQQLLDALADSSKKVAILIAPAVRVSLAEMFGLPIGTVLTEKIVGAFKQLGADYVFDVSVGADFTITEEANELLARLNSNSDMPLFTSCCPAWVQFAKTFYPQCVPNLSSCKSPIAMLSSLVKNIFAKQNNIVPQNLYVVAIVPCLAKKAEANLRSLYGEYGKETDLVLSSREVCNLLADRKLDLNEVQPSCFDQPFGKPSMSGVGFGASGGVLSATINTAYYLQTGLIQPKDLIKFKSSTEIEGVRIASVNLGQKTLKLCTVYGTANARKILDNIKKYNFDFVEVMACPNGCVGGGGQPRQKDNAAAVQMRGESLTNIEADAKYSFQNPQIKEIYSQFNSDKNQTAQTLLHINHGAR